MLLGAVLLARSPWLLTAPARLATTSLRRGSRPGLRPAAARPARSPTCPTCPTRPTHGRREALDRDPRAALDIAWLHPRLIMLASIRALLRPKSPLPPHLLPLPAVPRFCAQVLARQGQPQGRPHQLEPDRRRDAHQPLGLSCAPAPALMWRPAQRLFSVSDPTPCDA